MPATVSVTIVTTATGEVQFPRERRHVNGIGWLIPAPVKPCDNGNNSDIGESPRSGSSNATHMESSRDQTVMSVARGL